MAGKPLTEATAKRRPWWPQPEAGKVYGRWTVLEFDRKTHKTTCRCACGRIKTILAITLKQGTSRSCGCWAPELMRDAMTTHGASVGYKRTKEYSTWHHMIQRCYNPNKGRNFKDYGGRGITVCDRWRSDFAAFLADVGEAPSSKHSIDRIDNDGNYEPGNVRWATVREQNLNRRNTVMAVVDGEEIPIAIIAERAGLKWKTVRSRKRLGWPDSKLGAPLHTTNRDYQRKATA